MEFNCCVPECSSKNNSIVDGRAIRFYFFPIITELKQKWMDQINISAKKLNKKSRVCEYHFDQQCFTSARLGIKLTVDAVPTIFSNKNKKKDDPVVVDVTTNKTADININNDVIVLKENSAKSSFEADKTIKKRIIETNKGGKIKNAANNISKNKKAESYNISDKELISLFDHHEIYLNNIHSKTRSQKSASNNKLNPVSDLKQNETQLNHEKTNSSEVISNMKSVSIQGSENKLKKKLENKIVKQKLCEQKNSFEDSGISDSHHSSSVNVDLFPEETNGQNTKEGTVDKKLLPYELRVCLSKLNTTQTSLKIDSQKPQILDIKQMLSPKKRKKSTVAEVREKSVSPKRNKLEQPSGMLKNILAGTNVVKKDRKLTESPEKLDNLSKNAVTQREHANRGNKKKDLATKRKNESDEITKINSEKKEVYDKATELNKIGEPPSNDTTGFENIKKKRRKSNKSVESEDIVCAEFPILNNLDSLKQLKLQVLPNENVPIGHDNHLLAKQSESIQKDNDESLVEQDPISKTLKISDKCDEINVSQQGKIVQTRKTQSTQSKSLKSMKSEPKVTRNRKNRNETKQEKITMDEPCDSKETSLNSQKILEVGKQDDKVEEKKRNSFKNKNKDKVKIDTAPMDKTDTNTNSRPSLEIKNDTQDSISANDKHSKCIPDVHLTIQSNKGQKPIKENCLTDLPEFRDVVVISNSMNKKTGRRNESLKQIEKLDEKSIEKSNKLSSSDKSIPEKEHSIDLNEKMKECELQNSETNALEVSNISFEQVDNNSTTEINEISYQKNEIILKEIESTIKARETNENDVKIDQNKISRQKRKIKQESKIEEVCLDSSPEHFENKRKNMKNKRGRRSNKNVGILEITLDDEPYFEVVPQTKSKNSDQNQIGAKSKIHLKDQPQDVDSVTLEDTISHIDKNVSKESVDKDHKLSNNITDVADANVKKCEGIINIKDTQSIIMTDNEIILNEENSHDNHIFKENTVGSSLKTGVESDCGMDQPFENSSNRSNPRDISNKVIPRNKKEDSVNNTSKNNKNEDINCKIRDIESEILVLEKDNFSNQPQKVENVCIQPPQIENKKNNLQGNKFTLQKNKVNLVEQNLDELNNDKGELEQNLKTNSNKLDDTLVTQNNEKGQTKFESINLTKDTVELHKNIEEKIEKHNSPNYKQELQEEKSVENNSVYEEKSKQDKSQETSSHSDDELIIDFESKPKSQTNNTSKYSSIKSFSKSFSNNSYNKSYKSLQTSEIKNNTIPLKGKYRLIIHIDKILDDNSSAQQETKNSQCEKSSPGSSQSKIEIHDLLDNSEEDSTSERLENDSRRFCNACNKGFRLNRDYKSHLSKIHMNGPLDFPYSCKSCTLFFAKELDLQEHVHLNNSTQNNNIKNTSSRIQIKELPVKNEVIKLSDSEENSETEDSDLVEVQDPSKPIECKVCCKQFENIKTMKEHLKSHYINL